MINMDDIETVFLDDGSVRRTHRPTQITVTCKGTTLGLSRIDSLQALITKVRQAQLQPLLGWGIRHVATGNWMPYCFSNQWAPARGEGDQPRIFYDKRSAENTLALWAKHYASSFGEAEIVPLTVQVQP